MNRYPPVVTIETIRSKEADMDRTEFAAVRAAKEMTQAEIAAYLGVTLRSAQRYEYGDRRIPPAVAERMRALAKKGKR